MPRYEFREGTSSKFWQIDLDGDSFTTTWGRIGTNGQSATKTFADAAKAKLEHDRLVAEKVKKGYVLVDGTSTPAAAAPAPRARAVEPKTPPATQAAVPRLEPPQLPAVGREILLDGDDWRWATWRNVAPLAVPPETPFDRDAVVARIAKVRATSYGWEWDYSPAKLSPSMSKEEARLFLESMFDVKRDETPKQRAEALGKQGNLPPLTLTQVLKKLEQQRDPPIEFALVLSRLFSPAEATEVLLAQKPASNGHGGGGRFLNGYRKWVLPYLSEADRAALRQRIGPDITVAGFPTNPYEEPNGAYLLGAMLGVHTELEALVSSWPDDRFRGQDWIDAYQVPQVIVFGLGSAALVDQHMRRLGLRLKEPHYIRAWLAHTEYAGLDLAVQAVVEETNKDRAAELAEVLALVRAPENAAPMLEIATRSKAAPVGSHWIEENVELAVRRLAVIAAGRGTLADAATTRLTGLERAGYAALVGEACKAAGLEKQPTQALPEAGDDELPAGLRKGPAFKAPPWWSPVALRPPVLRSDKILPIGALDVLAARIKSAADQEEDALDDIREACTPESLADFGWDLFNAWLGGGAPSKDKWAFQALGWLGNDATARKLTPLIRAWPGESQHQRAVLGLDVLGRIGTDVAMMMLNGIAQKVKFKGLQERARQKMDAIAEKRGLTAEELSDRLVPDLDLEDDGSKTLDFGPRSFRVGFDETLTPFVMDATGARLKDLPKPNSKDDAPLAAHAVEAWKVMKKDARTISSLQVLRLELGMSNARRWAPTDFEAFLVHHPLLIHLVRRVVWGTWQKGELAHTFRVAEDRTFANVEDETFTLPDLAAVGIVHRLQLSDEAATRWGKVFADYELLQPFEQLARQVHMLSDAERKGDTLKRFEGRVVESKKLLGLGSRGWRKGDPQDAGCIFNFYKPIANDLFADLEFSTGLNAGGMDYVDPTQTLGTIQFLNTRPSWGRSAPLSIESIDPVVLSEVLRDVDLLTGQ